MGGRRPTGLPLRTQQETEETLWGSQWPTLEEIIHKCLCKATHPPTTPGHLPAELCTGTFALQALHRDKPTPVSRLLTGAVTGHEIESKANEKAASRPRSLPWGIIGRRLACSPKVDPHRWPMFHGCGDKSGHRESELSPRPNQIPVGRSALPFPSRTPVTIGNLRESQPHPPPTPHSLHSFQPLSAAYIEKKEIGTAVNLRDPSQGQSEFRMPRSCLPPLGGQEQWTAPPRGCLGGQDFLIFVRG